MRALDSLPNCFLFNTELVLNQNIGEAGEARETTAYLAATAACDAKTRSRRRPPPNERKGRSEIVIATKRFLRENCGDKL